MEGEDHRRAAAKAAAEREAAERAQRGAELQRKLAALAAARGLVQGGYMGRAGQGQASVG